LRFDLLYRNRNQTLQAPAGRLKKKAPIPGRFILLRLLFRHWVAFALVAVYRPRLFAAAASWWWLDYFLTALVMAWLSGLQWALMCWLMDKAGK
jgi:hypothetical protein